MRHWRREAMPEHHEATVLVMSQRLDDTYVWAILFSGVCFFLVRTLQYALSKDLIG